MFRLLLIPVLISVVAFTVSSCGNEDAKKPPAGTSSKDADAGHHSGKVIELGSKPIGPYSVRASRDEGPITPGKDAPIDVWVEGAGTPKVGAVRFWIGTQDAKGSVKARAQIEFPDQPN